MEKSGLLLRLSVLGTIGFVLAGPVLPSALASPTRNDLKSDLELEIEGRYPDEPKPRNETPAKPHKGVKSPATAEPPAAEVRAPHPVTAPAPVAAPAPAPVPPVPAPVAAPAPSPAAPAQVAAPPTITTPASEPALGNGIEARIEQAQKFMDQKQYDSVVRLLQPVNNSLPRAGLLLLARAYGATKESLNELRTLELCLAKNPKDYVVLTAYGLALVKMNGRLEDGMNAFQEARKLNPRYKPAYEALVKELEKKGERYEARNVVTDMVNIFGPEPRFYSTLCRLYALDGFNEKSVEVCEEAIKNDPKNPENHVYLSQALKEREMGDRSTAVLSRASARFPASEVVQTAMGNMYLEKKDYVRAYEFFKKAAVADPQSARAWVGYANSAFQLQKNQESLNAFVKACKADRQETKDFRLAIGALRVRKDVLWQSRFEDGINQCQ